MAKLDLNNKFISYQINYKIIFRMFLIKTTIKKIILELLILQIIFVNNY
jgi:hypothetical protein